MDIISLGKASKVLRDIQKVDEEIVAKKAESRFLSVDARLDWIEAQASQIMAENSMEVDLSQKTFDDTVLKDGSIQLRELAPEKYVGNGTWESGIVDMGEGWQKTKQIVIDKEN
jgi:hypothetical protein